MSDYTDIILSFCDWINGWKRGDVFNISHDQHNCCVYIHFGDDEKYTVHVPPMGTVDYGLLDTYLINKNNLIHNLNICRSLNKIRI